MVLQLINSRLGNIERANIYGNTKQSVLGKEMWQRFFKWRAYSGSVRV